MIMILILFSINILFNVLKIVISLSSFQESHNFQKNVWGVCCYIQQRLVYLQLANVSCSCEHSWKLSPRWSYIRPNYIVKVQNCENDKMTWCQLLETTRIQIFNPCNFRSIRH